MRHRTEMIVEQKLRSAYMPRAIKLLRSTLDLTQERFAAKVGVTVSTVNRWENGKGRPSPLATLRIEELRKEGAAKVSTAK